MDLTDRKPATPAPDEAIRAFVRSSEHPDALRAFIDQAQPETTAQRHALDVADEALTESELRLMDGNR